MTKAYSYLRFSTPEQARGDSFRRQTELAAAYAAAHGLELDDALTFEDLGVSAFRGANAIEGALGRFLAAVDDGRVAKGSYLLVENLDRLSRDKIMPALNRFSALLEKGVIVVTLSDQKVYTAESLNNLPDLMLSLLVMSRAHDESKVKSGRLAAVWDARRQRAKAEGKPATSIAPKWLRLADGKFELIPERAEIVRRIFRMAIEGQGKMAIARKLNAEGVSCFNSKKGWYGSYVYRILNNPAVIGRYHPMKYPNGHNGGAEPAGEPVEGYFPAALEDPNDFYRVKKGVTYRSGERPNLLSGLVYCAACGSAMHYRPGRNNYLKCSSRTRGLGCDAPLVNYSVVWEAIRECLSDELSLRALLGSPGEQQSEADRELAALEGRIAGAQVAVDNLLDALQHGPSAALAGRLAEKESELRRLQGERGTLAAARPVEGGPLMESLKILADRAEMGVRVNAALKRTVARIETGKDQRALYWFTGETSFSYDDADKYDAIVATGGVSVVVHFQLPNRKLIVFAHPSKAGRFVAGVVHGQQASVDPNTVKISY